VTMVMMPKPPKTAPSTGSTKPEGKEGEAEAARG
jgi:hypothetical protein